MPFDGSSNTSLKWEECATGSVDICIGVTSLRSLLPIPSETTVPTTVLLRIINDSITLLSSPGKWIKGQMKDDFSARYCLVGAVREVTGEINYHHEAIVCRRLLDAILLFKMPSVLSENSCLLALAWFNDYPTTRYEDIMSLLFRTREQLQQEL